MFNLFKNSGIGGGPNAQDLMSQGALVLDVRTPAEFAGGHVKGSRNIPVDELSRHINELKALNKPIVTCCASGMRSGRAAGMLSAEGIVCANGGPWQNVNGMKA